MPSKLEQLDEEEDERTYLLEAGGHESSSDHRIEIDEQCGYFERKRRTKLLRKFYEEQDRLVGLYAGDARNLERMDTHDFFQKAREHKQDTLKFKWDQRYARIIFVINIAVFGGNLAASILSGSYAVISAFIDSMMDIFSSVVVQITIWAIKNTNKITYPRGRQRLELMAVIGCSIFMGVANLMMIIQSIEAIITNSVHPEANWPTVIIMSSSIVVKITLMIICYRHGTTNAKILALDQRNDVITAIVALSGAYIGGNYFLYADPIGAILVCSFVAISWFWNALDQVPLMVGKRGEQEELSRILVIALAHDVRIKCLDHVMVYHIGERALAELHIVLDEHLPLKVTHDICESLQLKINSLNFVERSFIHVDYYCDGCNDGR